MVVTRALVREDEGEDDMVEHEREGTWTEEENRRRTGGGGEEQRTEGEHRNNTI